MSIKPQKPIFDLSVIHTIAGGDCDLEKEFIRAFIKETKSSLELLTKNLAEGGRGDEWCDIAHHLKGSAANIGATDLYQACYLAQEKGEQKADSIERTKLAQEIRALALALIEHLEIFELQNKSE